MRNFKKIPYKYFVNALLKLKKTFSLHFLELFLKKCKYAFMKEIRMKHRLFGATKLCESRKFYTTAGCDG